MTTVDLSVEAAVEARRLANARALLHEGDQRACLELESDATWIAMPRRASLKRTLGGRLCLVWRVTIEDASGRMVESRLVPVILEVGHGIDRPKRFANRREWVQSLLRDADGLIRARVEASCDTWQAEVIRLAGAFSSARRPRVMDASGSSNGRHRVSQPGLFDRRAERSRQARVSAFAEAEHLAAERGHAIAASKEITPRPARLLLVIVP